MHAPTPFSARHFVVVAVLVLFTFFLLFVTGCGSADTPVSVPSLREMAASNADVQLELEAQKGKAKQSAAEAIAARLAKVTSDVKASDAEKVAAQARAEAETARELADNAALAATAASKRAYSLENAAEAERKHVQIITAQSYCHWIAGILTLIAVLATIDVIASYFITQISFTRSLAQGVAAGGFAAAAAVMVIATLIPFLWWIGAILLVLVAGAYLYHRHDTMVKTEAVGKAHDDLTVAALSRIKQEMGGVQMDGVVAAVEDKWKPVWGNVKGLVDKLKSVV